MSADDVAGKTGCNRRLVREWLDGQAAGGLIGYDIATDLYELSPEAEWALADDSSPAFVARAMNAFGSMFMDIDKITTAFRGNGALSWGDHPPACSRARSGSSAPATGPNCRAGFGALDGVAAKLDAGATVADVGCGHGASAIVLAQAYPNAHIHGFDFHEPSITTARERAEEAGVSSQTTFEVADAKGYRGSYDLICFFDCLARHGRSGRHRRVRPRPASPTAARSCSSSRSPSTTATATSPRTRWPPFCTRRRRASARRTRSRRRSVSAWAHRPVRRGCATCSRRPGSPASGGRPRHPSTSSSRLASDRAVERRRAPLDRTS